MSSLKTLAPAIHQALCQLEDKSVATKTAQYLAGQQLADKIIVDIPRKIAAALIGNQNHAEVCLVRRYYAEYNSCYFKYPTLKDMFSRRPDPRWFDYVARRVWDYCVAHKLQPVMGTYFKDGSLDASHLLIQWDNHHIHMLLAAIGKQCPAKNADGPLANAADSPPVLLGDDSSLKELWHRLEHRQTGVDKALLMAAIESLSGYSFAEKSFMHFVMLKFEDLAEKVGEYPDTETRTDFIGEYAYFRSEGVTRTVMGITESGWATALTLYFARS